MTFEVSLYRFDVILSTEGSQKDIIVSGYLNGFCTDYSTIVPKVDKSHASFGVPPPWKEEGNGTPIFEQINPKTHTNPKRNGQKPFSQSFLNEPDLLNPFA